MQYSTAPVLFESSGDYAVVHDPVNEDWVNLIDAITDARFGELARRYYLALYDLRKQQARPALPGRIEIEASSKQQAFESMLEKMEQRKAERKNAEAPLAPDEVFVNPLPERRESPFPDALRDFSVKPPPLIQLLGGVGRPPCDALGLLRAFLAAPLLGVEDNPTAVHRALHGNPAFAHLCGFLGCTTLREPFELTSRRLPSLATCEEFSEVMMRYGLWHLASHDQVVENLATGAVLPEQTLVFDTTHLKANSHCGNVVPPEAKVDDDEKPRERKVPRMFKCCDCGKDHWPHCIHVWSPTDQGAAVVVKGPSRIYWAHKASVAVFAESEIPLDVRVCLYAAESDGKTLVPHLEVLQLDFPQITARLTHVLADDAYRGNEEAVARFGQQARLIVPVHPRKAPAGLAEEFVGIDRFTPVGFPICLGEHRFELYGRDLPNERFIWVAPLDDEGRPVCAGCPFSDGCVRKGQRRFLRVDRKDQPQIDWDHPQLFARDLARYQRRTGVERAIKRLKVDLKGEHLTHRDARRVQAHLDRKLLTLHLLLAVAASA